VRVLVCARSDPASVNVRDRMLELGGWEPTNRTFRGAPVWSQSEAILIEVAGPSVTDEALDLDLRALNLPLRDVWFLSKHRAASGQPSLTVHPIGNHGDAAFGGKASTLCTAAPRDMGALLRRLRARRDEAALPHQVTYEATHHGPGMGLPSLFVELGSDERWYGDPAGAAALAKAVQDVLSGEGRIARDAPILVGVGGGHYAPRQTDVALDGRADFGHLVPRHALEQAGEGWKDLLARAVAATPGCTGVHLHRKGLSGPQRAAVEAWCADQGIAAWRESAAE